MIRSSILYCCVVVSCCTNMSPALTAAVCRVKIMLLQAVLLTRCSVECSRLCGAVSATESARLSRRSLSDYGVLGYDDVQIGKKINNSSEETAVTIFSIAEFRRSSSCFT
jgi:hypothetical protein